LEKSDQLETADKLVVEAELHHAGSRSRTAH
jgi:hypothetical protein